VTEFNFVRRLINFSWCYEKEVKSDTTVGNARFKMTSPPTTVLLLVKHKLCYFPLPGKNSQIAFLFCVSD
jgi:hypothetical protein